MNPARSLVLAVFVVSALTGCRAFDLCKHEEDIPVANLPAPVMNAVQQVAPGIKVMEADVQTTHEGQIYEVEGMTDARKYHLKLTAEGTLLKLWSKECEKDEHHHGDREDHHD